MSDTFRVGESLGTTIYAGERYDDQQPVVIVINLPLLAARALAERIVAALNREETP